jgi:uncharacterized membrane protein
MPNLWFGPDITRDASTGFGDMLSNLRMPRVYRISCLYIFIVLPFFAAIYLAILGIWVLFLSLIWVAQLIVLIIAFPFAVRHALKERKSRINNAKAEEILRRWVEEGM